MENIVTFAAVVITYVADLKKIIVVREPAKALSGARLYAKIPGGGVEESESSMEAAIREVFGETGESVKIPKSALKEVGRTHHTRADTNHWRIFFWAEITTRDFTGDLGTIGDEGEVWSLEDPSIIYSEEFLPSQAEFLKTLIAQRSIEFK
ncbi:MAG: NUDIX domain-containing protein [Candidatus Vogelbacteria bacterium]|nr:NUDIX domain-containing protein [Candidatus Vogelbacteria bacterium]